MGKIIFLDVDGTLVDYKGRIPESAAAAVRLARQRGHKVYICTGRSRAEVYPEIWDIGLGGMIGGNGNYVEDHGQVIMHRCLSLGECRGIVDWLHERKLEFYLECNAGLFGSENFETAGEPVILRRSIALTPMPWRIHRGTSTVFFSYYRDAIEHCRKRGYKVTEEG